jgi:hypothetical protein
MSVGTSRNVSAASGRRAISGSAVGPAGLRRAVKRELQDGRGVVGRQVSPAVVAAGAGQRRPGDGLDAQVVRAGPQQHMPFVPFMTAGAFLIVLAGTTK